MSQPLRVKASKLLETIWLPYYASKYEQDFFGKPTKIVVDHVTDSDDKDVDSIYCPRNNCDVNFRQPAVHMARM